MYHIMRLCNNNSASDSDSASPNSGSDDPSAELTQKRKEWKAEGLARATAEQHSMYTHTTRFMCASCGSNDTRYRHRARLGHRYDGHVIFVQCVSCSLQWQEQ
jgi:DNA-directed RNA polymerase subunit M/transcription elongation factor TFIIS